MTDICLNPWIIKCKTEALAWSSEFGWVCPSNDFPDRFSDADRLRTRLPMEGEWYLIEPRLIETTERASYWEVEVGLYQATKPGADAPPQNGAGYKSLEALKKLKGDK